MFNTKKEINRELEAASLVVLTENSSYVTEQYRMLKANITFSTKHFAFKTLMVTSSVTGEGKSTTAANLAVVFAESGKQILIVDCDMRRPTVNRTFKLSNSVGLSHLLSDSEVPYDEVIHPSGVPNLDVITSGFVPQDPSALLSSENFDLIINDLKQSYDLIIFDTPPVNVVSDAQILSSKIDGVLLVARKNVTKKKSFLSAKEQLLRANANILGSVYKISDKEEQGKYYKYVDI